MSQDGILKKFSSNPQEGKKREAGMKKRHGANKHM